MRVRALPADHRAPEAGPLQWLNYPPKMDGVNAFDAVVPLEGVVETQHNRRPSRCLRRRWASPICQRPPKPLFRVPSEGLLAAQASFQRHRGRRSTASASAPGMTPARGPFEYCEQAVAAAGP